MQQKQKVREPLRFTDEQLEQARAVSLLELARGYGYELEDKERNAYHAKHSGGLYFFKDSNTYCHFGGDGKRHDAIQFVVEQDGISFVDAVKRLLGPSYEPARKAQREYLPPQEKKPLVLPKKAANFKRAYWYLVNQRGIDPTIVSAMMNQKRLYQGSYFNKETQQFESVCVFLGHDEAGKARYCSMRGADPDSSIKHDKAGSEKGYPFYMPGRSNKLYVCEAPIDALSHATLAKLYGMDWQEHHRITTGCLSDNALRWFLKHHPEINHICWCYDNDTDGRKPEPATREEYEAALAAGDASDFVVTPTGQVKRFVPWNWGQKAAERYAQQYMSQGYRVSIHTPDNNDFNEDLVAFHQRAARDREGELEAEADEYALEA